jgi:hypothetical protein
MNGLLCCTLRKALRFRRCVDEATACLALDEMVHCDVRWLGLVSASFVAG